MVITAVIISATAGGLGVYYGLKNQVPGVVTETATITSINTIVRVQTSTLTMTTPPTITVYGTVESENNYPVEIDFCRLREQSLPLTVNSSQYIEIGGGVTCGNYTSVVSNETSQTYANNLVYFLGQYSATLPNNATYLLQVRLLESRTGPSFEEQAGWLPLNYTTSPQIGSYGIACFDLEESGSINFQCSSGFG